MTLRISLQGASFPGGFQLPAAVPNIGDCLAFSRYGGSVESSVRNYGISGDATMVGSVDLRSNGFMTAGNADYFRYPVNADLSNDGFTMMIAFTVEANEGSGLANIWPPTDQTTGNYRMFTATTDGTFGTSPAAQTTPSLLVEGQAYIVSMVRHIDAPNGGAVRYHSTTDGTILEEHLFDFAGTGVTYRTGSEFEVGNASGPSATGLKLVHGAALWRTNLSGSVLQDAALALADTIR